NVEKDKSGPLFLNLLQELRIVFLQDSVVLKNKYPSYYLWSCAIFGTDLYRAYENQLLQAICNHSAPFHTSQMVQMSLPEMTAAIQAGFGSLSVQIKAYREDLEAYHKVQMNRVTALEHRIGQFFAVDNAQFNQAS
ncbi:hypothetical protein K501DRAFT_128240, partial [Backusella circina FSU 941]